MCHRAIRTAAQVAALGLLLAACGGSSGGAPSAPSAPGDPSTRILFDEAHFNYHRLNTTYVAFAELMRRNGWTVESSPERFTAASLARGSVLAISNALAQVNANVNNWSLPTPSAFAPDEIAAVRAWVEGGGALLLIADHMPFPGAAGDLAAAFGARFANGFAFDTRQLALPVTCLTADQIQIFRRSDASLVDHPITSGVESVGTFTGSAFETDGQLASLMVFGPTAVSLLPQTAWQIPQGTPRIPVSGWSQGAVGQIGRGRVGIFGEAAMFSEQFCGAGLPMGMNAPAARDNARFVVNLVNWLAGR